MPWIFFWLRICSCRPSTCFVAGFYTAPARFFGCTKQFTFSHRQNFINSVVWWWIWHLKYFQNLFCIFIPSSIIFELRKLNWKNLKKAQRKSFGMKINFENLRRAVYWIISLFLCLLLTITSSLFNNFTCHIVIFVQSITFVNSV